MDCVFCCPCVCEMCMKMNLTQSQSLWMTLILTVYMQLFLVIGSICFFFGCAVWFISDLKAWIVIVITLRCFIFVTVFTFENLSPSCAVRCALVILTGCIFSGAFADKKVLWVHFKGKRVSLWWSLISRLGFEVQIGAVFLTVSYIFCLFPRQYYLFKRPHLSLGQTFSQLLISALQINACVGPRCVFLSSPCAHPSQQMNCVSVTAEITTTYVRKTWLTWGKVHPGTLLWICDTSDLMSLMISVNVSWYFAVKTLPDRLQVTAVSAPPLVICVISSLQ